MKCPHCIQDHPDGFQFCPVTGKKIEVMKACSNQFCPATGKKIEVMKACTNPDCPDRYKYMLPADSRFCPTGGAKLEENNAKTNGTLTNATDSRNNTYWNDLDEKGSDITSAGFVLVNNNSVITCPRCGSSDVTYDGGSYLQYECEKCCHVWGDRNAIDELHKFFPIAGITLGETTLEEAEKNKNRYLYDIDYQFYDENGLVFIDCDKIVFLVSDTDNSISQASMYKYSFKKLPLKWYEQGFDWDLSYGEWISLFKNMRYEIKVKEEPHFVYCEFGRSWEAVLDACAPDRSIHFQLEFKFDVKSAYQLKQQKGTLDKIEVYS